MEEIILSVCLGPTAYCLLLENILNMTCSKENVLLSKRWEQANTHLRSDWNSNYVYIFDIEVRVTLFKRLWCWAVLYQQGGHYYQHQWDYRHHYGRQRWNTKWILAWVKGSFTLIGTIGDPFRTCHLLSLKPDSIYTLSNKISDNYTLNKLHSN